ncbi:hypothetical protein N7495_004226 [Penicillium taxi]|uniref:uncharacterized protein n=1 Tax=Penicillium taxi TaxID=168475 RepID=UPI002544EC55|nr:uncharacterized protein N7495_004226 [Penicillium taxi]KAJ5899482.1 hypothetical protein N7495_004226 [Penicillium taxi]
MSASTPQRTSLRRKIDLNLAELNANYDPEGLRQAPRVNQPFIPDTTPARRSHQNSDFQSPQAQPTPQINMNPAANPNSASFAVDSWDGKGQTQLPMSTKDVYTPGNRPASYERQAKLPKEPVNFYDPHFALRYLEVPRSTYHKLSPSEPFTDESTLADVIYKRAHYGLQSKIPDEVDFALFHLVQISNQRWDKFKFEGFPLLAETLMEKAMEITFLCTGVQWELIYDPKIFKVTDRVNSLNTLEGTRDLLERIKQIPLTLPANTLETDEFHHLFRNIKEATLVLRNMVLLKENAFYVATYAKGLLRDFLVVLINTPKHPRFNEIKNDALDIAEEVTKFMWTEPQDPLWISLVNCMHSNDRAHISRGLWSLTHFSLEMNEVDANRAVGSLSKENLQQMYYHTLLELDKEILSGTLDLWYQYTLSPENIETMMDVFSFPTIFVPRMIALLMYEARPGKSETVLQEEKVAPPPSEIPPVPSELMTKLMELAEPERSSQWMRCCFVEDADCEITQIALWQAYQNRFGERGGILPAAEFIKNVSNTFTNAQAQVINVPGSAPKFIIKGIRPLAATYSLQGFPYDYCKWADNSQPSKTCHRAFISPAHLRRHIFADHLNLELDETTNNFKMEATENPIHTCQWDRCTQFRSPNTNTALITGHIQTHLPEDRPANAEPPSAKRLVLQERLVRKWYYMDTPVDEKGNPFGVAYKAALILRNIARNLPDRLAPRFGNVSWKTACFVGRRSQIIDLWDRNRALRKELTELIMIIEKKD